ncbi:SpoIIE family protein phosphatase [Streptomyces sp. NPDC005907]|uniref:SpoIIE family protein phosphatase n=1 Tax=Streptomyces sp. NPDC005907 TaxID=3154571 RepID=UPI0033CD6AEC
MLAGREPSACAFRTSTTSSPPVPSTGAWSSATSAARGPQAAALTGLVRHTARAARRWDPESRSVLRAVNAAIVADHPAQRFCTAAYADLDLSTSPARLRLTLGEDGIRDILTRTHRSSAAATVAALEEEVLGYSPVPPGDDFAVLALRIT